METTNPAVVIARLQAEAFQNSNSSVLALPGCSIFDSTFCGNAVRVEYKAMAGIDPDECDFEDVAIECFWFAGRAFDLEGIADSQVEKWQKAAYAHAVEQGRGESLSIEINNLESA